MADLPALPSRCLMVVGATALEPVDLIMHLRQPPFCCPRIRWTAASPLGAVLHCLSCLQPWSSEVCLRIVVALLFAAAAGAAAGCLV
eukprot:2797604-Amphidinium_carterae.1